MEINTEGNEAKNSFSVADESPRPALARCTCDHFEHKDTGECITCGQFCGPISNAAGQSMLDTWNASAQAVKHILFTKETCRCNKWSDYPCPICDGGLAVCLTCGKAEAELDTPCYPAIYGQATSEQKG